MHVYMNIHNYVTQGNYAPPEIRLSKKKKNTIVPWKGNRPAKSYMGTQGTE